MLIEGTNQRDTILIGQLADGRIHVDFQTTNPNTGAHEAWQILAPWRANVDPSADDDPSTVGDAYYDPALPLDPAGKPLVEQFRISGLMRDDDIEFVADPYLANAGTPAQVTVLPLDIGDLNERSNDFVGVIDGGPGRRFHGGHRRARPPGRRQRQRHDLRPGRRRPPVGRFDRGRGERLHRRLRHPLRRARRRRPDRRSRHQRPVRLDEEPAAGWRHASSACSSIRRIPTARCSTTTAT